MKKLLIFLLPAILMASCKKQSGEPAGPEKNTPVITITEVGNVILQYDCTSASIHYTVANPVENAMVYPESSADWISDFDTSEEGTVSFSVTENDTEESRNTILTLRYAYAEGETMAQINIIQEASGFNYILEVSNVFGYYYSNRQSANYKYNLWLAENPMDENLVSVGDGLSYCFDIYTASEPEDMNTMAPPAGVYTLSENNEAGTFGIANSRVINKTADGISTAYFSEGTLTITKESDQYTYEAALTDTKGERHKVTYTGPVVLKDFTEGSYISTLHEDYEADLTNATFSAYYYGDYYMKGNTNWFITVSPLPASKDGDFFQFNICSPASSNMETGITPGRYEIMDAYYYDFSTLMGFVVSGTKYGSWFWVLDNGQQGNLIAPLVGGYVDISVEGETYTIEINANDDAIPINTITATWSGTITMQDLTTF